MPPTMILADVAAFFALATATARIRAAVGALT